MRMVFGSRSSGGMSRLVRALPSSAPSALRTTMGAGSAATEPMLWTTTVTVLRSADSVTSSREIAKSGRLPAGLAASWRSSMTVSWLCGSSIGRRVALSTSSRRVVVTASGVSS